MKQTRWCVIGLLMLSLLGCAAEEKVSQPESFAAPPDAASQKGDTAPGPP